jgi:hypothetical protein
VFVEPGRDQSMAVAANDSTLSKGRVEVELADETDP